MTEEHRATLESWIVRAQISLAEGQPQVARVQLEAALQALYAEAGAQPSQAQAGEAVGDTQAPVISRDFLGQIVREAWVKWADHQLNPKPSWIVPYEELGETDKEADRQIGEAVARWALSIKGADWSHIAASSVAQARAAEAEAVCGPVAGGALYIPIPASGPTSPVASNERDGLTKTWVSVDECLPEGRHECTSSGTDVSDSVFISGDSIGGSPGFGVGHLQSDGIWVCYEGEHDFMHITNVSFWMPFPSTHALFVAHTGEGES